MTVPWTDEEEAAWHAAMSNGSSAGEPLRGSWEPMPLAAIVAGVVAGEIVGPVPSIMARTDGVCLLYRGEIAQLAGEPESCKGWVALGESACRLAANEAVLYVDFEDAPASIVARLLALGAEPEAIVERFAYVRPLDAFDAERFALVIRSRSFALAVIDGVSEAYALLGFDIADNLDAAKFLAALPRPIAEAGAAVVLVDHVAKSRETRGRYALGAQHKLAGVGSAYSTEVIRAPSRQTEGLIKLRVEKDRHGHVRGHAVGDVIALVRIAPHDDGARVTVTLEPPEGSSAAPDEFRPTVLMERVSKYIEGEPGSTLRTIRSGVSGKGAYVDQALRILVAEKFVEQRQDGQANRHYSAREYREDSDRVPVSRPCPDRVPDTVSEPCPRVPSLQGTRDTGHGHSDDATATVSQDAAQGAPPGDWTEDRAQALIDRENEATT